MRKTMLVPFTFLAPFAVPAMAGGEPIEVLVVSGANNHDWRWTSPALERMLEQTGRFEVDITYEPATTLADAAAIAKYAVFVLDYNGPRWGEPAETNFLAAVRGGAGVAVIHAANNAFVGTADQPGWSEYEKLVGDLWHTGTTSHGKVHPFDLEIVDNRHPITEGLGAIEAHPDELYHGLVRTPGTNHAVLATAFSSIESGGSGKDEPMILVGTYGLGRVFHTPLGHVWPGVESTRASQEDPQFQRIVARGVEWAATGNIGADQMVALDAAAALPQTGRDGWRPLFDGKSTSAWRGYKQRGFPEKGWKIVGDALVCEKAGSGGDLISVEQFGDFELAFEFKTTPKANSGVMYRVVELDGPTWYSGPEYQVLDGAYFEGPVDLNHSVGALYDICPAAKDAVGRPSGEWNQARIVVQGFKVAHYLNGALVAACDFASPEGQARVRASKFFSVTDPSQFMTNARGHIALQDHGDEVAYRNIKVRELGADTLALFNGRDLGGWTWVGAGSALIGDVWSVTDAGVLVCRGTPTGYIRTETDYTNYVLELDWRWNPDSEANCNSGVLLRMIEEDMVWPRSLEAQLQQGNAGDFWKINDFPCSTDPERTKGRNCKKTHAAEKPLGEWNHYRISVDHGTVTLEVNGQEVNRATDVLETPGKICLQSEGAEIHFKDIHLTRLP